MGVVSGVTIPPIMIRYRYQLFVIALAPLPTAASYYPVFQRLVAIPGGRPNPGREALAKQRYPPSRTAATFPTLLTRIRYLMATFQEQYTA